MMRRRLLLGTLTGTLAGTSAGALSGCVTIPTSGGVEPADARPRQPNPQVEVAPEPPPPGSSPLDVVSGFLQAMAYYQPDYGVARQYLATPIRSGWHPESGVAIFANDYYPSATDTSATLQAPLAGRILADGSYESTGSQLNLDFGLVKESGEWRISKPPSGLLVSQYDFDQFYRTFNLYFFEPHMGSLVPDPIYLPNGNQTATTLMTRLLRGPTEWLRPAVVSALPAETTLSLSAPMDSAGVVDVSFSDAVASVSDQQRSLIAAQVTWTLKQLSGVTGVRFTVSGRHWAVPRDEVDQVVPVSALEMDGPIPQQVSTQLVGATDSGVVRIDDAGGRLARVEGPWGSTKGITSLAMTAEGSEVAGVINDVALKTAPLADAKVASSINGERLLRPEYSRFGELWTVDSRSQGPSEFWRIVDGKATRIHATALEGGGRVLAFRLSPDGVRMAIIQQREGTLQLGLVAVNRARANPVLSSWRAVGVYQPQGTPVRVLADVAWLDATTLMALGAPDATSQLSPYTTRQDGSSTKAAGNPDQWNAAMLASSPREPPAVRAVLKGAKGQVWRYEDDYTWVQIAEGLRTVAYAG